MNEHILFNGPDSSVFISSVIPFFNHLQKFHGATSMPKNSSMVNSKCFILSNKSKI